MDNPFRKLGGGLKVHGGDFPSGTRLVLQDGKACLELPDETDRRADSPVDGRVELTKDTVIELSVVGEETVRPLGRAITFGAAGAAIPGGSVLGALIGVLLAGKRKDVTFILKLTDGRRLMATTDAKKLFPLQAVVF